MLLINLIFEFCVVIVQAGCTPRAWLLSDLATWGGHALEISQPSACIRTILIRRVSYFLLVGALCSICLYRRVTRAPGPESGSQSTWERWSESGFESSLPPCKRNQSGSESPCIIPMSNSV